METTTTNIKALREIITLANQFEVDSRELAQNWGENDDFEVGNYRFISLHAIDAIMCEELKSDEYILGCFNAWFLAGILDIEESVIESMQKSEAYESIGKLIISLGKLEELQQEYALADGYGHHFNNYDGSAEEESVNGVSYYCFKIN